MKQSKACSALRIRRIQHDRNKTEGHADYLPSAKVYFDVREKGINLAEEDDARIL